MPKCSAVKSGENRRTEPYGPHASVVEPIAATGFSDLDRRVPGAGPVQHGGPIVVVVRYGILGPLEVRSESTVLRLGGPRQRGVLARLLVDAGRVVSTDALLDAVWSERPPATALKTLKKYIAELRKVLGPGVLRTEGGGYVIDAGPDQVDARNFERLVGEAQRTADTDQPDRAAGMFEEAEGLWRGEVLADFPDAEFATRERVRLGELRLSAWEAGLELELAMGHYTQVAARAAELVELQPLRERLWSALMTALAESGRTPEALRCYQRYRRLLGDELGLEPSAQLRALEHRIVRGESDGRPEVLPRPSHNLPGRSRRLSGDPPFRPTSSRRSSNVGW